MAGVSPPVRAVNDPRQYDDLADQWWEPRGRFAMLQWICAARARLVPAADRPGSVLLDVACGGGLLAPHVAGLGHRHIGVDVSPTACSAARDHAVTPVQGDALALPLRDEAADVVVAGELLEHIDDLSGCVSELCRVLRPGGTLVLDTIARTAWARLSAITVGERMPGGPPPRLHDGDLFVDRAVLIRECERHRVPLTLTGLRPSARDYVSWLAHRRTDVRMVTTRVTAGLFQGVGTKARGVGA